MKLEFSGDVAFVTGAARGQGRSHAVALAHQGVNIVAVDMCQSVDSVPYPLATPEDLEETARQIKECGVDVLTIRADVRDLDAMIAAARTAVEQFGHIDYLVANAGIWSNGGATHEIGKKMWDDVIDTNLNGVWHSVKAVLPYMEIAGQGRVVATCSSVVQHVDPHTAHYSAAKTGVLAIIKVLATEVAHLGITANAVSPSNVGTDMIMNDTIYKLYRPDLDNPTFEDARDAYGATHAMGIPYIEPRVVSESVLFLLSEQSKYITGIELPVQFGRLGGI